MPRPSSSRSDVKNFFGGEGLIALPRTVAQSLGNASPLLVSILKAKGTAYSYNPKEEVEASEDPFATGEQVSLISALQARNSARFTILGSVEALQNKWFDASVQALIGQKTKTVNRAFAKQLSQWAFMESGVLKVGKIQHHLSSIKQEANNQNITQLGNLNPKIYRVKNDVVSNN